MYYINGKKGTFVTVYNTLKRAEMGMIDIDIIEAENGDTHITITRGMNKYE